MNLKAYWQQISDREQMALLAAGICIVSYLFYVLIYAPMSTMVIRDGTDWKNKQSTLVWMQKMEQVYHASNKPQAVTPDNFLSLLTKVLNQASFHRFPYQMAQTSTGDIQLSFAQVPYNSFISWLQIQTTKYMLSIKTLDISRTRIPGVVKVTVIFAV